MFRRTAVVDGEVGEVCPAAAELDGGVSLQTFYRVSSGVLQGGCDCQSCHPH